MVKYKLVDTLLYQSEEGAVQGKFIIGVKLPRLVEAVDFLDCFLGIH